MLHATPKLLLVRQNSCIRQVAKDKISSSDTKHFSIFAKLKVSVLIEFLLAQW
jgi:RAB protein geranylgeranyltransferase component A